MNRFFAHSYASQESKGNTATEQGPDKTYTKHTVVLSIIVNALQCLSNSICLSDVSTVA